MSEEILKALTQLFAIITKQDGGVTEKERQFVIGFFKKELDQDSVKEYVDLYDKFAGYKKESDKESEKSDAEKSEEKPKRKRKLTSVRDSVKTLGIGKKINKTLTQKQKVVVIVKILELVGSDKNFTPQRMEIIDTISKVFNIGDYEYKLIENFVLKELLDELQFDDILIANNSEQEIRKVLEKEEEEAETPEQANHLNANIEGNLVFMRVKSVDMYFVKYMGHDENVLNGFIMIPDRVYLFSQGSTIKTVAGDAMYYSDLVAHFLHDLKVTKLSFNAENIEFTFPNGAIGLRDVSIYEGPGKLIGIMGASGAGKTTLLNVLAGIETPSKGKILINGLDLNAEADKLQGVIGYVAQDDLLIEELTVYQNLYYNAKLCFANLTEEELDARVMEVLTALGLDQRRDLRVGSVLDKTISGGQRKRLNIALELIREPAVMFVDEPTSGLSSRDSENVIDLLKELSLKGKLIFVVIHQPSSDIYKMFDKMYMMDTGGFPIFYGNPVEAVTYFKQLTNQIDSQRGQCETCGNVNPEQIFNIVEAKVVDEYGQETNKRKVTPPQWNEHYIDKFKLVKVEDVEEAPPNSLHIPSKLKQTVIFTIRDTISKLSNKQYLLINLLEAPLLAFLLAFIIKYKNSPDKSEYFYRFNENIPAFMLMSIIVALFMGLTVSAEEIIRDRKILKRESFLNLSWNSYLVSKLLILFAMSAIQTLSFVLIGNIILEIQGMTFSFWFVLFTISCMSNVLGLNVSSAFNSAVTVYIIIPLLLIPQMILSGLLFNFDKLNELIGTKGKVPLVADMMASRWAYEALAVDQYMNNEFEKKYYLLEKVEKESDFKSAYLINELRNKASFILENYKSDSSELIKQVENDLLVIQNELREEKQIAGKVEQAESLGQLSLSTFDAATHKALLAYLENLETHYQTRYNKAVQRKEQTISLNEMKEGEENYNTMKDLYFNESLAELVRNIAVKERIIEQNGQLFQQLESVYNNGKIPKHAMDYRTHFFAPKKFIFNTYIDTYNFNMMAIWAMTLVLYLTLYFEVLRKVLRLLSKIKLGKS